MEAETVFIILGLTLTGMALVISFLGVRMESFPPSRGALLGGVGLFAAVIAGTLAFAWTGAEEEQEHRNELIAAGEEPSPAEVVEETKAQSAATAEEDEGETPADATGETASADGAAIFEEQGCSGCHTLEAAGSTGTTGPDLDAELKGEDVAFIEESIVDPEKEIEQGYPAGVMPDNYGDVLSPEELKALVAFIAESVGAKS